MRHSNLVTKYKRGQMHFEKGNFRRAKWIFEQIALEISSSDTDSMGDINLHNSCEEYLEIIEVNTKDNKFNLFLDPIFFFIIGIVVILSLIVYLIFKYAV
jgi:hypothetical protein